MNIARMPLKLFATLILVGLSAEGCSGPSTDVSTLDFWAMGDQADKVALLVPDFERQHPEIRINIQKIPWSVAHEKLLTAFAGESTPDMCQLGNTWIPELAALGAIDELDEAVDRSMTIDAGDYFAGIWSTNVVNGKLYGVPWYVDTRLLFYRKDILAAAGFPNPPTTWHEWLQSMRAIKAHSDEGNYSIILPFEEYQPLVILAMQRGNSLLRDRQTRGNFHSEEFKQALVFYRQMFDENLALPTASAKVSNVWNEFARGRFAFYITGPWNIAEFRQRLPAAMQDKWATAPMPGPNELGTSLAGGASLVIFKNSDKKKEAWKWIEYLSRPENQVKLHGLTGNLPSRRTAWAVDALRNDEPSQAFYQQLERTAATPMVPEWERIADEVRLAGERVVRGIQTVDETAADLNERVDRILEKRRWMLQRDSGQ